MATFILVHGTHAKFAHWPALTDKLTETARAAGDAPSFEQVRWTGKNRSGARQDAASSIFTVVKRIQRTSANEKIFIIGHSHGGSAIAYFLKEHPEAANTLAGCAFLSTPFVAIRPRREPVGLIVPLLLFPYMFFISIWNEITWPDANLHFNYLDDASVWFLGVVIAMAIVWSTRFFFKRASRPHQVEQSIRQQTADIPAGNYCFLRCSGDEAAAALSFAQFIGWLGMWVPKLLGLLTRPLFSVGRPFVQAVSWVVFAIVLRAIAYGWLVVLPVICKLGFGFFLSPDGRFVEKLDFVGMIITFVSFGVLCLSCVCLCTVLLVFVTQAVTSWAFGWMRLSTGFLVELAVEPLPFGTHSLVHVDWTAGSIGLDGIVHSWTYAHPVAIMHLQDWIRASLGKLPTTAPEPSPKELS